MTRMPLKLVAFASLWFVAGCGAGVTIHTSLSVTARAVNLAGENVVKVCDSREQAIVERTGHTFEEDLAALDVVRFECNTYFDAIDRIRLAHDAAVQAYEAVKDKLPEGVE